MFALGKGDQVELGSIVGPAALYGWMWMVFCSPLFSQAGYARAIDGVAVYILWCMAKVATFAWYSFRGGTFARQTPLVAAVAGVAGTVFVLASPVLVTFHWAFGILVVSGPVLLGVSWAALLVGWNAAYASLDYEAIYRNVALFAGVGAMCFLVGLSLGEVAELVLGCLLPLVSGVLLKREGGVLSAPSVSSDDELPEEASPRHAFGTAFSSLGLPRSLVLAAMVMGAAVACTKGDGSAVVFSSEVMGEQLLYVAIVCLALIALVVKSVRFVYCGSYILVAGGLLSLPLGHSEVTASLVGIGFICFQVSLWILIASISRKRQLAPSVACARLWLFLEVGMLAGGLGSIAVLVFEGDGLLVIFVYNMLAFVVLLLFSATAAQSYLSIIGEESLARQSESQYQQRVEKAIKAFGLTAREGEILRLIAYGRDTNYIMDSLTISRNTAKTHLRHIYEKFGVGTRQELLDRIDEQDVEK